MTIKLYNTSSPKEQVHKNITEVASLSGTLRDESSIIRPVITIEKASPTGFNYAYISEFGRYYYIEDVTVVRNNLIRLTLRCDVLMSFESDIRSCDALVRKSASSFNVLINDNSLRSYQNDLYTYKLFPSGFGTNFEYVLLVAGQ